MDIRGDKGNVDWSRWEHQFAASSLFQVYVLILMKIFWTRLFLWKAYSNGNHFMNSNFLPLTVCFQVDKKREGEGGVGKV